MELAGFLSLTCYNWRKGCYKGRQLLLHVIPWIVHPQVVDEGFPGGQKLEGQLSR